MSAESITIEMAQRPLFAGVDVGGTSIKIGIVDDRGRTLSFTNFATETDKGPQHSVNRAAETIQHLLESSSLKKSDLAAIGLGTPGTMDIPKGMILEPPNLPGWRHFPIRDALSEATGHPVAYANDAGAATYGEYWVGTGREHDSIVMLTLGTGVGAGIIVHGKSIDGQNSHGSECGHAIVDSSPNARICSCGRPGHLEAYASATAVIKRTQEAIQAGRATSIANRIAMGEKLNGLMVAQEAENGDDLAMEIVLETADYLAIGCANLIFTIDPGAVILGGAMTFGGMTNPVGKAFMQRLREQTYSKVFPVQAENIAIEFAQLGSAAGYIGAAGIARQMIE